MATTPTAGNDTLTGTSTADNLDGLAGNDSISGLGSGDTLNGGPGDDTLEGGASGDIMFGGTGNDWLSYSGSSAGVTIDLSDRSAAIPGHTGGRGYGGDAASDFFKEFENVEGSNAADSLTGDSSANHLKGLGGDDTIDGSGGDDTIEGGAGRDSLTGGTGTDRLSYEGSNAGVSVNLATGVVSGAMHKGTP